MQRSYRGETIAMYAKGKIRIRVMNVEHQPMLVDSPGTEGFIIGRSDGSTNYIPDIDFANAKAREMGVSRKHAALVRYRGTVQVIDLNSVNGTFLNDERLIPDVPYPLKNGDQLRLGNLELVISQVAAD